MIEFGEVKFEPTVLRSKISLKRTARELEIHRANITAQAVFSREVENPRGGSEGVSSFGPLVQSFRPRPLRSLKNLEHLSIPNAKQNQTPMKKEKTSRLINGRALGALTLALIFIATANAQPNLTWQTPVTISGTSDVSTQGIYFGSWAPQDGSANTLPVNGVTFQGFSDLPDLTPGATLDNGYDGFGSPNTSDDNYNTLLKYARFSNEGSTPATFSWSGMTPGNTYLIQLWVNDGRDIGESRSETVTGGANTSAPLSFGSDGSGPGQYIIGTFVADSSGGQTLTVTPFSTGANPNAQINLFQVRDITATLVPAPTITGFAVSGLTLTLTATNGPSNGAFVLLGSANVRLPLAQWTPVLTNSFDENSAINLSTNVVNPSNPQEFYILRTQQ